MYVNAFEGFLDIVPFLRPTLAILDERPHDVIMLGNFVRPRFLRSSILL